MKFGVIGLGSMGSRRVRDLLASGHEVLGFDLREDRNTRASGRFGIETVGSLPALFAAGLDALVVSTPPDQHAACYQAAYNVGLPFFSEASILTPKLEWLAAEERRSGVCGYPSATWRFYAPLVELAARIAAGTHPKIYAVHHEYADFLPRWHPWEHYSQFYAGSRRETSAAREMVPFEFEWLCWLFGEVASVSAVVRRLRNWDTDIDDAYFIQAEFVSGVQATVRIELHREAPGRSATVCAPETSYRVDFESDSLLRFDSALLAWAVEDLPETARSSRDLEKSYAAEITTFADAVAGVAPYPKSWQEDRHLSDILVAAERSSAERRWVDIEEVSASYDGLWLD
jgi:predicted dehydrogenase